MIELEITNTNIDFGSVKYNVQQDLTESQKNQARTNIGAGTPYTLPIANESTLGGVKPVNKTSDMTQNVGVDANGKLYTIATDLSDYSTTEEMNEAINAHHDSTKADNVALLQEIANRQSAIQNVQGNLNTEITNRQTADTNLQSAIDLKQEVLVSGTNIKTVNNQSVLGSGNIQIDGVTNFNDLNNRPKYNGSVMTGNTNIPEVKTSTWDNKQDAINDLSTIRSGASLGATAVQPSAISDMATKTYVGSYHDSTKADTSSLTTEISARETADNALQNAINLKVSNVTINNTSIVENNVAKIVYETGLGSDSNNTATVTAIRNFVNSSIESVAAYYITSNTSGNAFASKSALDAGPWYYAGSLRTPTRNDYAIVTADETHSNLTARYAYTDNQWAFQYTFNTGLTQTQIDAINSGINATKVALYDAHILNLNNPHSVSKAQVGLSNVSNTEDSDTPEQNGTKKFTTGGAYTELNKKVDKTLTVNGHALSSNITVTKSDVGLSDVGNFKAVSTVANQGLTTTEQLNARTNINAGNVYTSNNTLGTPLIVNADTFYNHPIDYFATAEDLQLKQDIYDNNLKTNCKTIIGAINELKEMLDTLTNTN